MEFLDPPRGRALSAGLALCSVLCLTSAFWPLTPQTPVVVWYTASAVLALLAAVQMAVGARRSSVPVLLAAVVLTGLLLASCRSLTGLVTTGLGVPAAVQYAACLGDRRGFRSVLAVAVVGLTAGMWASPVPFAPTVWLVLVVVTVGGGLILARIVGRLRGFASVDDLTGALARSAFDERAAHALETSRRWGEPVSVVCIDVDDFKSLNDTRGHLAGDHALVELVSALQTCLGRRDVLGRVGGDEFVVVLPGRSRRSADHWVRAARRAGTDAVAQWSEGVAEVGRGETMAEAVARADRALYRRKELRSRSAARNARRAAPDSRAGSGRTSGGSGATAGTTPSTP